MAEGNPIPGSALYKDDGTLDKLQKQFVGIQTAMNAVVATGVELTKTIHGISPSKGGSTKALEDAANQISVLTNKKRELAQAEEATQKQIDQTTAAISKQKAENKAAARQAIATKGTIEDLRATLAVVTIKWSKLTEEEIKNTKYGRDLNAEKTRLTQTLKRLEAATGDHRREVGNYGKALGGLLQSAKQLVGVYLSLSGAQRLVNEVFGQTKALNSQKIALEQVLGSSEKAAKAQEFLRDISERLGIDLITASKSYLKFRAAAESSGLSVEATNKTFESFAKVGSVLGLSTAELDRLFKGLEQTLSKGTVSSEELRGQIGDILPGAFTAAAASIGVTTGELQKMLKNGEVVSKDFLPKFAAQIEKAYGTANQQRVDNLAAAQGRFNRSVTLVIEKLDASGAFKEFFDTLTKGMNFIGDNLSTLITLGKVVGALAAAWLTWKLSMIATNAVMKSFIGLSAAQAIEMKGLSVATKLTATAFGTLEKAIKANPIGLLLTGVLLLVPALLKANEATKEITKSVDDLRGSVFEESKSITENIQKIRSHKSAQDERHAAYEELKRQYPEILANYTEEQIRVGNIIDLQKQLASAVIDRIANEKKAEADKKLFVATQAANDFTPAFFSTGNKVLGAGETLGVDEKDIERERSKRRQKAIDEYNAETKAIDTTAEALKNLNIVKVESDGPKGRSFGASQAITDELAKAAKAADEVVTKSDKAFQFAQGTIGFINDKIADLNKTLQNTTSESVITETTKQIIALEAEVARIQSLIDRARVEATSGKRDTSITAPLTLTNEEVLSGVGDVAQSLLEKSLKEKGLPEKLAEGFAKIWQDTKNEIVRKDTENAGVDDTKDIFDLLGFTKLDDKKKAAITEAFDFAKQQALDFLAFQKDIAQQELDLANQKVNEANDALAQAKEDRRAGFADEVNTKRAELALAKKTQEDALRNRQKAQKAELALNTALEASNLGVAIAKTLAAGLGFAAIPLVALMLGAFAASKIKAFSLVNKQQFGEGGLEIIGGGTHASGHDTPLGFTTASGKQAYGEKDEAHMIIDAKRSRQYRSELPLVFNAIKRGELHKIMSLNDRMNATLPPVFVGATTDTKGIESRLDKLIRNKPDQVIMNPDGSRTEIRGRNKYTYR